jgi:hypothetical protein
VTPPEQNRDQIQAALGDAYTIERELDGGGTTWRVFVAKSAELSRDVVVKVLTPPLGDVVDEARFTREISFAARLEDPTIVPILTWSRPRSSADADGGGVAYFTMPLVAGESLREKKMPAERALVVLRDVARALAHAHGRGVLHRALTADKVFFAGDGAVVAGFGVVRAMEQALGRTPDPAVDNRADLRAFGVLADDLISGARRPALASLIARCKSENPADRPESASDVVAALDDMLSPSLGLLDQFWPTDSATIDARREYYRSRLMVVLGALVVVAAVVGVLVARHAAPRDPAAPRVAAPASVVARSARPPSPGDSLARVAATWLARSDSGASPTDVAQRARDAIARGLTLDPENPSLRFSEGVVAYLYDRDASAALGYMRGAVTDDPNVVGAITWYPQVLWANGLRDTAGMFVRAAVRRDSTSRATLEAAWEYAHRSGDALRALQYCGALRQMRSAAYCEAMQQVDVSRTDVALALTERAAAAAGTRNTGAQLDYVKVLVTARLIDSAKKIVAAVDREASAHSSASSYMPPDDIALMHGFVGDRAGAMEWFARALAEGSPGVGALYWRTVDNPIRTDPALLVFANNAGLKAPPPYWR